MRVREGRWGENRCSVMLGVEIQMRRGLPKQLVEHFDRLDAAQPDALGGLHVINQMNSD